MDSVEPLCHNFCESCFAYEERKNEGRAGGGREQMRTRASEKYVQPESMARSERWVKHVPEPGIPDTAKRSRCEVGVAVYLT